MGGKAVNAALCLVLVITFATVAYAVSTFLPQSPGAATAATFTTGTGGEQLPVVSWNGRIVVLFFDDAWESQFQYALPLLQEYGFHATFGVVVGSLNYAGFFSTSQVSELYADGMEIASHTATHPNLTALPADRLRFELVDSKRQLEEITHAPVTTLIIPYDNALTPTVEQAIIDAGYASIRPMEGTLWAYGQNASEVESRIANATSPVLLTYHQIRDYNASNCCAGGFENGRCTTPPAYFAHEMAYLYEHGYRVVSWKECLASGCYHFSWPIQACALSVSLLALRGILDDDAVSKHSSRTNIP